MTESGVKVVMDGDGLTISGVSFSLTTNGSDPGTVDTVVSELQAVARGTYGQYCGLSRAVEAVGERWGMLIVRDLLVSPKSTSELHQGLPLAPLRLLSLRLREMAYTGVVEKDDTTDPAGEIRYRLTEFGRGLEPALHELGLWGSAMLAEPRPEDIITETSLMAAMRATFQPELAEGRAERFEVRVGGVVINVVVDGDLLEVAPGPLAGAPVIEPGPLLKDLLSGRITAEDAIATGTVSGDPAALDAFFSMFSLPDVPVPERSII